MDSCTQLQVQGPARTCNESKEEKEETLTILAENHFPMANASGAEAGLVHKIGHGLVLQAHGFLYHSTLGLRVTIMKNCHYRVTMKKTLTISAENHFPMARTKCAVVSRRARIQGSQTFVSLNRRLARNHGEKGDLDDLGGEPLPDGVRLPRFEQRRQRTFPNGTRCKLEASTTRKHAVVPSRARI